MYLTRMFMVLLAAASSVIATPTPSPVPAEAMLADNPGDTTDNRQSI